MALRYKGILLYVSSDIWLTDIIYTSKPMLAIRSDLGPQYWVRVGMQWCEPQDHMAAP
jgi:hypothetical protein